MNTTHTLKWMQNGSQLANEWQSPHLLTYCTSWHLYRKVYESSFASAGLSTRKQTSGEVILQIPPSLCQPSYYEVTNIDKKTTIGLPSCNQ